MTDERDPVRWADGASDCDPVLRRVLDNARAGLGDAARADALARAIEQAVRANAATGDGGGGESGPAMGGAGLGRWLAGVGIAGVIAGLGAAAWHARSGPAASEAGAGERSESRAARAEVVGSVAEAASRQSAARAPGASDEAAPTAAAESQHEREASAHTVPPHVADRASPAGSRDAPAAGAAPSATRRGRKGAGHSRPGARTAQSDPRSPTDPAPDAVNPARTDVPPELELLSAAQRALRASPAEALELADTHARAYPSGRFVEEREEIAITALLALGDHAAGRARARAFLARYPRSLSAPRIAALLEDER